MTMLSNFKKTGIKLNLQHSLERKILLEKFSLKIKMYDIIMSNLDGCDCFKNSDYPGSTFYIKNGKFILEVDSEVNSFYIKFDMFMGELYTIENSFSERNRTFRLYIKNGIKHYLNIKANHFDIFGLSASAVGKFENKLKEFYKV